MLLLRQQHTADGRPGDKTSSGDTLGGGVDPSNIMAEHTTLVSLLRSYTMAKRL